MKWLCEKLKKIESFFKPSTSKKPSPKQDTFIEKKIQELSHISIEVTAKSYAAIVIHHSATPDQKSLDWAAIKRYHMSWRYNDKIITNSKATLLTKRNRTPIPPWSDIGYHWGVEEAAGDIKIVKGRPMNRRGAHVRDGEFNSFSIGVCLVGNYDLEVPSKERLVVLVLLVQKLMGIFQISRNQVIGHREAQEIAGIPTSARKTCPGTQFDMQEFRGLLV